MRQPKSKIELFKALLLLAPKMETFKKTGEVKLASNEIEFMKEVYPDVQVLGGGAMPVQLNTQCAGCIRDAFQVFTSLYDRLSKDEDVNENAQEILDQEEKDNAPAPEKPKSKTAEEKKADKQFRDRIGKLIELGFVKVEGSYELKHDVLKINIPLNVLKTESEESFLANYSKSKEDLSKIEEAKLTERFNSRVLQLAEVGYVFGEDGKGFSKGADGYLDYETVKSLDETPFNDVLNLLKEEFEAEKEQSENDRIAAEKKEAADKDKADKEAKEAKAKEPAKTNTEQVAANETPKPEEPKAKTVKKKVTFENPE